MKFASFKSFLRAIMRRISLPYFLVHEDVVILRQDNLDPQFLHEVVKLFFHAFKRLDHPTAVLGKAVVEAESTAIVAMVREIVGGNHHALQVNLVKRGVIADKAHAPLQRKRIGEHFRVIGDYQAIRLSEVVPAIEGPGIIDKDMVNITVWLEKLRRQRRQVATNNNPYTSVTPLEHPDRFQEHESVLGRIHSCCHIKTTVPSPISLNPSSSIS